MMFFLVASFLYILLLPTHHDFVAWFAASFPLLPHSPLLRVRLPPKGHSEIPMAFVESALDATAPASEHASTLTGSVRQIFEKIPGPAAFLQLNPPNPDADIVQEAAQAVSLKRRKISRKWLQVFSSMSSSKCPWDNRMSQSAHRFKGDNTTCFVFFPFRMKVNKHFDRHADASNLRDHIEGQALPVAEKPPKIPSRSLQLQTHVLSGP
jgi:hypothetical protein